MAHAEKEMGNGSALSGLSLADDSDRALKEWYRQYKEADGDLMEAESPLLTEVQDDILDDSEIEDWIEKALQTVHVEKGFCTGCSDMFNNWPSIGIKHANHGIARKISTSEMEAARRKGCRCCAFIFSQTHADTLDAFRRIEKRLAILGCTDTCSISVWNWGSLATSQCLWVNLPGKITTSANAKLARLWKFDSDVVPPGTELNDEPIGQLDHAKVWLKKCDQSHELCKSKSSTERPRRLVWIADESIRLVLTDTMLDVPLYATLSYCWGRTEFIRLTRDNLEDFLNSIPREQLPKTFTDAIFTARALGLQYIWIDSLCIIQGESDHLDWISESGKMRSVYGSAYVNIAATTGTDVHKGCFTQDPNYNGGFVARVTTKRRCCIQTFHARDVYDASTSKTHLATRAWTLQERLLAPRTIYLGDQGLFCECRSTWRSEYLPEVSSDTSSRKLVIPEDTPWDWQRIVKWYSAANMTNPSDKLPALSGIARRQHEATGSRYLAGMWEENLLRQLVWLCLDAGVRPQWRAPSWSWTSVDAPVEYWQYWNCGPEYEIGTDEFARVLDAWTTPAGPDPFGAVTDGELRIGCRALVSGCIIENKGEDGVTFSIDTSDEIFTLWMDANDEKSTTSGETLILLPLIGGKSGRGGYASVATKEPEEKAQNAEQDLSAAGELDLSDQDDIDSDIGELEWEEISISGLVLSSVDKKLGQFRRVGSFEFRHEMPLRSPDTKKDRYTEFMRVMQETGASTAASWCSEILPGDEAHDMPYVIIIK